ncbi:MAG: SGNH/GDSL hydrolase family protein [Verrucomicrobia bacterium]|nr:SGNH/GDSL hydrolase family protein [Verrucomicrobiota bacterium]
MTVPFKKDDLILFIGDSITDCGRDRNDLASLGMGYAAMLAGRLGLERAELNLRFLNRGIGGDSTCHLLARWDEDCIELKPDWVSILIGVNNTWRRYDQNDPTQDGVFSTECRELLEHVQNETSAKIVICSPFLLHTDPSIEKMREDLDPKIGILRKLAEEFGAIWVDFDAAFVAAKGRQIPSYWAFDGVHPTMAGHALMANAWMQTVVG